MGEIPSGRGPAAISGDIRITTCIGNVRIDKIQPKWELGTYTGRTFIVNALSLGITSNIVMKWTSHSDYKAMKPQSASWTISRPAK